MGRQLWVENPDSFFVDFLVRSVFLDLLLSGWIFSRSWSGRFSVTDLQSSRASSGEAHSSSTFPSLAFANRIIRCASAIPFHSLRSFFFFLEANKFACSVKILFTSQVRRLAVVSRVSPLTTEVSCRLSAAAAEASLPAIRKHCTRRRCLLLLFFFSTSHVGSSEDFCKIWD